MPAPTVTATLSLRLTRIMMAPGRGGLRVTDSEPLPVSEPRAGHATAAGDSDSFRVNLKGPGRGGRRGGRGAWHGSATGSVSDSELEVTLVKDCPASHPTAIFADSESDLAHIDLA
jgi:hypothetical protein